ncbi:nuclear transport factor 2 family protein [Gramella lutea]|uniref:Nuclear transport factor 2 family protein n=1 Tax=Christiangramia lutea TaxID=1607951 RepID=A0A9X2A9R0_9FLAO|nr:nuclear transport factor 2 family protein [Christiangramia lutea]MCH4823600.1 nuclear transport factor 2 family protein [Christiangramia lutea]
MKKFICFILLLFLAFGSNAQDSSELKGTIESNSDKMQAAIAAADMQKFGNFFAEDVMFKMSGQQPLNGKAAVISAHKPMAEGGLKLKVNTEEVMDFGEYAYERIMKFILLMEIK